MQLELLPARPELAPDLFQIVNNSRDFINAWLPWAETTRTVADEENFLNHMADQAVARKAFMFILRADNQVVGSIDLHNVNHTDRHAEIGYFLDQNATGQGIMHSAVAQIERFGFDDLNLNKITIMAASANTPSRLVAERAGYHFDGYLRDEIQLHGQFHDCAVYSKLSSEK